MRIGSLFSGIGGLELGLEWGTGGRTVWQVEQDAFARSVLAHRWPGADRSITDVCEAGADNLAPVDLICGGFPCQDISLAGKGAGLAGARSGLWREFARIIGEMGPRFVVVENVSALVNRGLSTVLGDLAALGFDAEWTTLRASDVGAPHRRERLFVVAWRVADADGGGLESERGERLLDGKRAALGNDLHAWGRVQAESQPSFCRVADGLPVWARKRGARLKALGNAVVPQVAEVVGRRVAELAGGAS